MQYVLGENATTAPTTGYTTSIPTATEVGTYYVWYKVVGDDNHNGTEPASIVVNIKAKETPAAPVVSTETPVLLMKAAAKGSSSLKFTWNKTAGAASYEVYLAKCGKATPKKVKTLSASKTSWTKKKLKKKTTYKFYVVAKDANGNVIDMSLTGHVITGKSKGKYTNAKSLKLNTSSVSLKSGEIFKIKATQKKAVKGKKLLRHAALLRYRSNNTAVATVSSDGVITAAGKGSCQIYVQTVSGIWKTVTVTVE